MNWTESSTRVSVQALFISMRPAQVTFPEVCIPSSLMGEAAWVLFRFFVQDSKIISGSIKVSCSKRYMKGSSAKLSNSSTGHHSNHHQGRVDDLKEWLTVASATANVGIKGKVKAAAASVVFHATRGWKWFPSFLQETCQSKGRRDPVFAGLL